MKKSTIRTEKRPKKFRLLRAYSILSYEHPPFRRPLFLRKIRKMIAKRFPLYI